jgi:DNA invertase Pin-like site-specific DNA recombinase
MNALRPQPPFQVVVMSEESRFGREQIETAYLFKQITDAGVRVFFYLEDRERTLDSALDKVMLSLTNFAAEMEREKARQRTYDAVLRKAKAGYVASGKVYGYDNVEMVSAAPGTDDRGTRLHVVRRVNEEQAAVVRRIFELCAGGKGFTRIAKALNQDGVTPPRGDGRGAGHRPPCARCSTDRSIGARSCGTRAKRSTGAVTVVLWLRGLTIREYILSRDPAAGTVYIGMLGLFAIMPLLVARRSDGLIGTP